MNDTLQPILIHDGRDSWVVYPEDQAYRYISQMERDGEGVVKADLGFIAKVKGWWYQEAYTRVASRVEALGIPWAELRPSENDLKMGIEALSAKLVRVAGYMMLVGQEVSKLDARVYLAKSALEHAVNKRLGTEEGRQTVGVRTALIISGDKTLRDARLDIWETEALRRSLEGTLGSLETAWKTLSRVLAVKLKEPVE